MAVGKRYGKFRWRSKRANHGRKGARGAPKRWGKKRRRRCRSVDVPPEPPERFELAVGQMDVRLGDLSHNAARIEGFIRESVGARLCVFPECAITGYTFESLDEARRYAETIPGPSTAKVAQVCGERGVHVVVGLVERDEDRVYNSLALIGPGGATGL